MVLHSSKLVSLWLQPWCVFCICLIMCVRVCGDAMVAQTCDAETSQGCQALIGYVPSSNYPLSEIALLFSLNYSSLLGPNDIDPSLQNLSNLVLPANIPYSIPQTCGCVSGKRVVTSTNYTVAPTNTLSLIANTFYSGLVTYQEIEAANQQITDPDKIFPGQTFTIPIPCACFNESNAAQPAIILSYQIQPGDTLPTIAEAHNTTAASLQKLNSLLNDSISQGSVLFVPLSVCKANFSSGALDKDLIVVEGKYELTANSCVLCSCINGTLHCISTPSSLGSSCSKITCGSSNIALGSSTASQGNGECTVQSCVYKGYTNQSNITAVLETEQASSCPVALPPESFYKPPTGLVASPLPGPQTTSPTPPTPPPPATTAPTPTGSNSTSASAFLIGVDFSSWWWCLLGTVLLF